MASLSDSEWMATKVNKKRYRYRMISFKAKNRTTPPFECIKLLQQRKDLLKNDCLPVISKEQRLLAAVGVNNTELVLDLLQSGVSANAVDAQHRSALHIAVSRGFVGVAKVLLKFKADPNKQDVIGNTPLHLAACTSNLEMITLLIEFGANISSLDLHGRNPLQLAESKLQILKHSWKSGTIEMRRLKHQLQQIVDIMISMSIIRGEWNKPLGDKDGKTNVDDLQMIKLSIDSGQEDMVNNQITQLEEQLKGFSFD